MKRKKYVLLLLTGFFFFSICFCFAQSKDQTLKYNVRVLGMNIGELTVKQQNIGNDTIIEAITDIEVKIIFTYRVKYLQQSLYRHGSLWNSHLQTIKNGKVHSDTWLTQNDETYILTKDGDSTLIYDRITYSGSLLYFNEPKQISSIYKEIDGVKSPIKCISDHTYIMMDEKNRKTNEYEYENGILNRASIKHPMVTIHLERSE